MYLADAYIPEFPYTSENINKEMSYICDRSAGTFELVCTYSVELVDSASITSADVGFSFAWGLGAILTIWALGYGIGAIKKALIQQ